MDELKTLSVIFDFFKWFGLIVGGVCLFFTIPVASECGGSEGDVFFLIGIFGFITSFSCWISKVLIDALNHIVTAARKYTND